MMRARTTFSRSSALAFAGALLVLVQLAAGALGSTATQARGRGHTGPSYLTGLGDEQATMFTSPLYKQLHTRIVRYVTPYDTAVRGDALAKATSWIAAAEADHEQVLVAFYHSEHTPTRLPSVKAYQNDVAKFVKDFRHVRQYQSWDEANRGEIRHILASPSATASAKYYQALIRVCRGCTVIGLDVLDAANISPTLRYISEFKREIYRLRTVMPRIWGLHNYSDVNRLESWRTRELMNALGGQVWLTETGGVVKFGSAFPNRHGAGLARAARVLRFMFALAASHAQIKRLYIYDWTGGTSSTRFDAGITNPHGRPRAGYLVVCRQLRAAHCRIRTVNS